MIGEIGRVVYFMLPGIIANMMPVLVKKISFLDIPISKRWFGSHKTYRGFFFGILGAIIIVNIQTEIYDLFVFKSLSLFPYDLYSPYLIGFLIGFGVLFGDLVKSFCKRRVGIAPGKRWFPFDQLDAVIGGLVFLSPLYVPPIRSILLLIVLVLFLHITFNHLGYYLGLKETKW